MAKKITAAQSAVLNTLTQVANGQLDADAAIAKIDRITEAAQVTQADADAVATDPTVAKALKARKAKPAKAEAAQVETKTVVTATGKRKKVKVDAAAQVAAAPALVEGSLDPAPVKVKAKKTWSKDQLIALLVEYAEKGQYAPDMVERIDGANLEQRGVDLDKITPAIVAAATEVVKVNAEKALAAKQRMGLLAAKLEGFIDDKAGRPEPAGAGEWYVGLREYLGDDKMLAEITLREINAAWKLYRVANPQAVNPLEQEVNEAVAKGESPAKVKSAKVKSAGKSSEGGGRSTILGHAMTAVIRWMGNDGWDFATARAVLDQLKAPAADNTVRWQLRAGRKEELPLADLSAAQQNELRGMRPTADDKPAKAEKSKKSAPKSEEVAEAPAKKSAKADAPKSTAKATAKGGKKKVAKKSKSN